MNQKNLAKYLQGVSIGAAIIGLLICFWVVPYLGKVLIWRKGEWYSDWYYPWLVLVWIVAIPCYMALYHFWGISKEIKRDNSFSNVNAKHLRSISHWCLIDVVIVFVASIVFLLIDLNQLGGFMLCMVVVCMGIVLAVLSAALSHLVYKAVALKEENDLTI